MVKGPGLYTDIGKKARDLLYKDHNNDHKLSITTYSPSGVAITSTGTKKGDILLGDVAFQLKQKNITTDLRVCTDNTLDYTDALIGGGFSFSNPNATQTCGWGKFFAAEM